jgi:hypothetical protein
VLYLPKRAILCLPLAVENLARAPDATCACARDDDCLGNVAT